MRPAVSRCLMVSLWLAWSALSFGSPSTIYYVDPIHGNDANEGTRPHAPFLTLQRAQAAVRSRVAHQDAGIITVLLREGVYRLDRPLGFGPEDSRQPGVVTRYRAYPGEHPVLNGGKIITGWTLHDPARNIWVANIVPGWNFRQLYVNGHKASRTASPVPVGTGKNATGYAIGDPALSRLGNPGDIEIVTRPHPWQVERLRIESIQPDRIVLAQPGLGLVQHGEYPGYGAILRLENAYEWIQNGGDWYLDRAASKLYYKPRAGEDMATTVVEAPLTAQLFVLKGSSQYPVTGLQFSGLTFTETTWLGPSGPSGFVTSQANQIILPSGTSNERGCSMPSAAVETIGARRITIDHCTFLQLGGQGINLLRASQDETVAHCNFHDLAASAIQVGSVGADVAQLPVTSSDIVSGITVADCVVHHVATEYPSGCGILVGHTRNCAVVHNELFDLPYTGISVGWGWINANERAAYRTGNLIASNRIHDHMKELVDGGGVYCNGFAADGVIARNYIYNQAHDFALIYLDDGSTNWTVRNNVTRGLSTGQAWYLFKGSGNHALGNFSDTGKVIDQAPPPGDATCSVEKTQVVMGKMWPLEAQLIMKEAGPR